MNWNAKLKGALHGEVEGADVAARVTGAYPLAELRRQLTDQRLEAELAHPGEEWRLTDDLAPLESPLWQAETLLALAQSLVEAEQEAHPDRPTMMSPASHDEALMLLGPLDAILAQVSTGLADPARRPALTGVNLITPTGLGRYQTLPTAYLKGVQRGAERLEGIALSAISDLETLIGRSGGPDWISQGIRGLRADLAGAQTTLQALGLRVAAPGGTQGGEAATVQLARELWQVVNAYLRAGQLVTAPRLMPGAAPILAPPPPWTPPPPQPAWTPPPSQPAWTPPPPQPAWTPPPSQPAWTPPPPQPAWTPPPSQPEWSPPQPQWTPPEQVWTPPDEAPRAMPEIAPAWEPAPAQNWNPPPPVEEPARSLPDIGAGRQWPDPAPPSPTPIAEEAPRPLPQIGAAPTPRPIPPAHTVDQAPKTVTPARAVVEGRGAPTPLAGDEARSLPRIDPAPRRVPSMPTRPEAPARPDEGAARPLPRIGAEPVPPSPAPASPAPPSTLAPATGDGRKIARSERWILSSTTARRAMRTRGEEDKAEHDLATFWDAKGWILSTADQAYLDAVAALTATGSLALAGRSLPSAPFPPIHAVSGRGAMVLGQSLPAGALLTFDHVRSRLLRLEPSEGVPD